MVALVPFPGRSAARALRGNRPGSTDVDCAVMPSRVSLVILRSMITPTRLQVLKMVSRSCVIMMTVRPSCWRRSMSSSSKAAALIGIEAGGGLVEHQQRGIERQRARQRGALDHAARELRGILARRLVGQADQPHLEQRQLVERARRQLQVLEHGQLHVLQHRERREQRALLEGDAVGRLDLLELGVRQLRQVAALACAPRRPAGAAGPGWSAAAPTCPSPNRRRCRTPRPARRSCRDPSCTTCAPKRFTSPRTSMSGSAIRCPAARMPRRTAHRRTARGRSTARRRR